MPSLMIATVTGHVARDPEMKRVGEHEVCEFSIPVNKGRRDNQTTTWVRVSVWGRPAEWAMRDVQKGTIVQATGELAVREYERREGGTGYSVELRADKVLALAGRRERASENGPNSNPGYGSPEPAGWGTPANSRDDGADLPF